MSPHTRHTALTILAAGMAASAVISTGAASGLASPDTETGETRELVNRADCSAGDIARGFDRCLFTGRWERAHAPEP